MKKDQTETANRMDAEAMKRGYTYRRDRKSENTNDCYYEGIEGDVHHGSGESLDEAKIDAAEKAIAESKKRHGK